MRIPWTGPTARLCRAVTAGLILATTVPAAAAQAAPPDRRVREAYVSMAGADAPGPAAHDRVRVLKVGDARARQDLLFAGAGKNTFPDTVVPFLTRLGER
ncbi:hypothetical protein [Streptomyces sp. NBC_01233]|uniref:hypothetical protein n=1 Tax=Streptomyces sp. NBC_01233 TaxID=2903787 RepID=UPI002E0E00B7|nr:hypothetical protein OG332_22515 [Streptomyces sp. NBC_01233]